MITSANSATVIPVSDRWLLRLRGAIRMRCNPVRLRSNQWQFIVAFLRKERRNITLMFCALLGSMAVEISIPLVAHFWESMIIRTLDSKAFFIGLPVAIIGIAIYIAFVGLNIFAEQRILRNLCNTLRDIHLTNALARPSLDPAQGVGQLVAKMTYHLSLLEVGIQQTVFGTCRWILTTLALIAISVFIDPWLLLFCLASVPLGLGAAGLTHLLSKHYVSREQTLSSRIIRETVNIAANHRMVQNLHAEDKPLAELRRLMELDAFFRIRRALLIRTSQAVLFVLVTLAAVIWLTLEITLGIGITSAGGSLFTLTAVSVLLVKNLFLSSRIGLYIFPLYLGAAISLPQTIPEEKKVPTVEPLRTFAVNCRRTRLSKNGPVHRHLRIETRCGEVVEIAGASGSGRSNFAAMIAGTMSEKRGSAASFRLNGTFCTYADWQQYGQAVLIDPLFSAHVSLLEWFTSSVGRSLPASGSAEHIYKKLSPYSELSFLLQQSGGLSTSWDDSAFSLQQRGLLQLARCFLSPPQVLVIDHLWFDLDDERFASLLRRLQTACPDMVIFCFTKGGDTSFSYDQRISF